jgi:PKD repeat protein
MRLVYEGQGHLDVPIQPEEVPPVPPPPPPPPPPTNQPPVAAISVDQYAGEVPLTVMFDGQGSYDTDGIITQYGWDFGDGTTGSGYVIQHQYPTAGTFIVSLVVTDNSGLSSAPETIQIIGQPPAITLLPLESGIMVSVSPEHPGPQDFITITAQYRTAVSNPHIDIIVDGTTVQQCDALVCIATLGPQSKDISSWIGYRDENGIWANIDKITPVESKAPLCSKAIDQDCDGILNDKDNCPSIFNPDQKDSEQIKCGNPRTGPRGNVIWPICLSDGIGDACDNCRDMVNPGKPQADSDGDCESLKKDPGYWDGKYGWIIDPQCGDACDRCPGQVDSIDENRDGTPDCLQDEDKDRVPDFRDNCPKEANPQQEDSDKDTVGNACDVCNKPDQTDDRIDNDGDGVPDCVDNCLNVKNPYDHYDSLKQVMIQEDWDGDRVGDACDCDDARQGPYETGIDCGGSCSPTCMDCWADAKLGSDGEAHLFSFDDPIVRKTALRALKEYANCLKDENCRRNLYYGASVVCDYSKVNPQYLMKKTDFIIEAVGYFVDEHMEWTHDDLWGSGAPNIAYAAYTIKDSGSRCSKEFCGDCEDHAILRNALIRSLGVSWRCAFCADHFNNYGGTSGHTFNIVVYKNRFRILDYEPLGAKFTSTWDREIPDNLWNDRVGEYWCSDLKESIAGPGGCGQIHAQSYTWNYPEGARCPTTWDGSKTYNENICP